MASGKKANAAEEFPILPVHRVECDIGPLQSASANPIVPPFRFGSDAVSSLPSRAHITKNTRSSSHWVYTELGHKDQAFVWLDTAYRERDFQMIRLKTNFALEPLHPDPALRGVGEESRPAAVTMALRISHPAGHAVSSWGMLSPTALPEKANAGFTIPAAKQELSQLSVRRADPSASRLRYGFRVR